MHEKGFAAAWTCPPNKTHRDGTFDHTDHMFKVRPRDLIAMYANEVVGVIGVGRARDKVKVLSKDDPERLRDFATEGQNKQEWRIPVEWLRWNETNPCKVQLIGTFVELTGPNHYDRVAELRRHFGL
jgi:hypothetical protein